MSLISPVELVSLQFRVIGALILREARATFGSSSFGYLWAIITPSASVGVLVYLFSLINRQPPFGSSLALFFATGVLVLQFYNEFSSKLMTVFDANKALITYPVIKDLDTVIARALLVCITYFLIMTLFFTVLVSIGMSESPEHPEILIYAFLGTAFLGFGMGSTNAVLASLWPTWIQIEKVISRPLFFISGIFYVPSQLPYEAVQVLKWNPVLHLIEWFREAFYTNYDSYILNESNPLLVGLCLVLIGLSGERIFRKHRF